MSLAKLLKDIIDEPACMVPEVEEKAIKLGFDPGLTTIGTVLMSALAVEAMEGKGMLYKQIFDNTESKHQMTPHQVADLGRQIVDIIKQEVSDPQERANISERIAKLV